MIPLAQITHWRNIAPWTDDVQVEQDLILSRVLVEIFSEPVLRQELAFRGGTALHKLFFNPASRYSEDIDLVRTGTGVISPTIDLLRARLDPWLGEPRTSRAANGFKLKYLFNPEGSSDRQRIKIEINTREHFTCFDRVSKEFEVQSDWFTGKASINTYQFSELIATKLRALYQRRKGRDIFDLWLALEHEAFDLPQVVEAFAFYMGKEGKVIRRDDFIKNLEDKLQERSFTDDIGPLLSPALRQTHSSYFSLESGGHLCLEEGSFLKTEGWDLHYAAKKIKEKILAFLPD